MTRLTQKTLVLYCLLSPVLIFFIVSRFLGVVFLSLGLITILYYLEKFQKVKRDHEKSNQ